MLQLLCQLPPSLVVWLVYLVPSYAMSSLYQQGDDSDAFYIYLGMVMNFVEYVFSILVFFEIIVNVNYPKQRTIVLDYKVALQQDFFIKGSLILISYKEKY